MRISYLLLKGERSPSSLAIDRPLQQVLRGLIPSSLRVAAPDRLAPDRLASDAPGARAVHRSLLRGHFHGSGETLYVGAAAVVTNSRATSPCASNRTCHL